MALQILISLSQEDSCGTLVINDITGAYNAINNLTGWKTVASGGTNIQIDNSSIIVALLTVTGDTFSKTFDLMQSSVWQALTPYSAGQPFDSSVTVDNLSFTLGVADLEIGVNYIPDGVITIELYVEDGVSSPSDNTFTAATYCGVKCARDEVIANTPNYYQCQKCNNEYIDTVNVIDGLYKALQLAACSDNLTEFATILATLQNIFDAMNITY